MSDTDTGTDHGTATSSGAARRRRRAHRPAGPAGATAAEVVVPAAPAPRAARPEWPAAVRGPGPGPLGPPPRRAPNRRMVVLVSAVAAVLALGLLGTAVAVMTVQQHRVQADLDHKQRYVDTAAQLVVNMFSFTQDTVEESVDRFYESTSGPLRDMLSHNNNTENLKAMFRDTNASSEAVVNGAALESYDPEGRRAAVLVSVRVTVTDMEGVNKPSQPYRMRVIVAEDEDGNMTGYDLKYPDGGN